MNLLLVHGNTRCLYGMLRLVHVNDIVIYTYEIQQIHVTFYLVSTRLRYMLQMLVYVDYTVRL